MTGVLLAAAIAAVPVVEIASDRGLYSVRVDATVAVPRPVVWSLLTDYARLGRLNPAIRESREVARDGSAVTVDTLTFACYGPFCRTLSHRQVVTEFPQTRIVAVTVDEHSDFRDGRAVWRLADHGDGTRLQYEMTIRPAVFVPPLVGPRIVRRAMAREVGALVAGIEQAAREERR